MRILFKLSGLALICLFVVHIVSCGQREEDNEVDAIALVSTEPSNGSTINANGIITVTFDGVPSNVSVNVGVLKQLGTTVTISGPFTPGPLSLSITWADGAQTLTYTVATPTSATTDLSPEPEPEITRTRTYYSRGNGLDPRRRIPDGQQRRERR